MVSHAGDIVNKPGQRSIPASQCFKLITDRANRTRVIAINAVKSEIGLVKLSDTVAMPGEELLSTSIYCAACCRR